MKNSAASANLEGLKLPSGWTVTKTIEATDDDTGGNFSNSYVVFKDGTEGFLKAFDFSEAFRANNAIDAVNLLTTAYMYERDILLHCGEKRLRKVVVALEHGDVQVPNFDPMSGRVFYLIFHLADGDMRNQISNQDRFDAAWCASALRHVTVGMFQIHKQMIAHQDLKPSNVLSFGDDFRIADFGRASRKGYPAVHDNFNIAGDTTYAPPEQLYGHLHPEFSVRRFGCDLYMLGNLTAFMFTGVNVTALLFTHLDDKLHHSRTNLTYPEVLPYLQDAFGKVIADINGAMNFRYSEEVSTFVRELCNPDLYKRGHPKFVGKSNQYSLERYISRLDLMEKKIAIGLRQLRKAA